MSAAFSYPLNSRTVYHTVIKLAGLYSSQFERYKVSFWLSTQSIACISIIFCHSVSIYGNYALLESFFPEGQDS